MSFFKQVNHKIIAHIMGLLLAVNGSFMLIASIMSAVYNDGVLQQMLLSGLVTLATGGLVMFLTRAHKKELHKRDGYIVVAMGWVIMSLAGTLPYLFTGAIPSFTKHIAAKKIIGFDLSEGMLSMARKKVNNTALQAKVDFIKGDGEAMPFEDNSFDVVTVSFGVRNFENLEKGLSEILRVLKKGGLFIILETSVPERFPFKQGYHIYSKNILPLVGSLFSNAFFETMSGYSTTGASILNDVESLPKGILFWRSITHWIGGMGIIVLAVAILPLLGIGGMQLFAAEAPGPGGDKLHPRITDTAKRLWLIYVGYTAAETLLLSLAGMSFFDAINHSLSTLSTGGFSTKNASIAHWNDTPLIQYIIMFFMFLAGTNFVLSYFAFKLKFSKIIRDEEFKTYSFLLISLTAIFAAVIYFKVDLSASSIVHPMVWGELEASVRHGLFQILAIVTTTGFVTSDYAIWTPILTISLFGLMFLGGSSGSTSGGIKIVRHLIMIKNGVLEFKRTLHPNAILPVRYNTRAVQRPIVFNILGFFILYMLSFIVGVIVFSVLGLDFKTALGAAASTLGNVGPALGDLGPVHTYADLPSLAKLWATFLMLIGRLELFTVLILFTPFFWRTR